jgi:hypothetical protein
MSDDKKIEPARLIVQLSIVIEDLEDGLGFYTELKNILSMYGDKIKINGMIHQNLEKCCTEKGAPNHAHQISQIRQ